MREINYREERRRRRLRRVLAAGIAAAAVAAVLVIVAAREPGADPCTAPVAASPAELSLLPDGMSFERVGTVTHVLRDGTNVTVLAVTSKPLDQATVLVQDAVTAAGYRPTGTDSEGSEAEVFFTAGAFAAGVARIEPSACSGRWDVNLVLLDRNAVPGGTAGG